LANELPVVIGIATVVQNITVAITNIATNNAPIYIAVTKAKKRDKNPPATAKEIKRETMKALIVATRRAN
jgi:hypothetical protein